MARVGLVDCPVVFREEVREALLLEADPVHEGAGLVAAGSRVDADGGVEAVEALAPHAPELLNIAAIPSRQPLAESLDGLRREVEFGDELVVDLPLEDALVATRHRIRDGLVRDGENPVERSRVEEVHAAPP